jgi:hypothetical protein
MLHGQEHPMGAYINLSTGANWLRIQRLQSLTFCCPFFFLISELDAEMYGSIGVEGEIITLCLGFCMKNMGPYFIRASRN